MRREEQKKEEKDGGDRERSKVGNRGKRAGGRGRGVENRRRGDHHVEGVIKDRSANRKESISCRSGHEELAAKNGGVQLGGSLEKVETRF